MNQVTIGIPIPAGFIQNYRIDLNASGTLSVSSISGIDTYGYLYDVNMSLITSNDDDGGGNNFLISTQLDAGTYCIGASGYGGGEVAIYDLNVTFFNK